MGSNFWFDMGPGPPLQDVGVEGLSGMSCGGMPPMGPPSPGPGNLLGPLGPGPLPGICGLGMGNRPPSWTPGVLGPPGLGTGNFWFLLESPGVMRPAPPGLGAGKLMFSCMLVGVAGVWGPPCPP